MIFICFSILSDIYGCLWKVGLVPTLCMELSNIVILCFFILSDMDVCVKWVCYPRYGIQ
jgi:hypothetical protein